MGGLSDIVDAEKTKRIVIQPMHKIADDLSAENLFRDEKIRTIASAMNSMALENKPENLFIYGKSGTGKTVCMKYLISKLEKPGRVIPVYLNCHEHCTKMAFFSKIAHQMGNPISRRGFAFYEVLEHIKRMLLKEKKALLLILDDIDTLSPSETFEILHPIVETNENGNSSIAIFAIAADFRFFEQMDTKIKSSLMFRVVELEAYTKNELENILGSVASKTLSEGSYEMDVLKKVAELGESGEGNASFAIWLLFTAAKNAEEKNSDKIELEDVAKAYESLMPSKGNGQNESGLCDEEVLILNILKEGEMESSEIYDVVLKKLNRSKRQIRNYLGSLVQKGHIEARETEDAISMLKPKMYRVCQRRLNEVYD
jgi:cell division control protein 6